MRCQSQRMKDHFSPNKTLTVNDNLLHEAI